MKKIIFVSLLLIACEAKLDTERLETVTKQQQLAGPKQPVAFLTLKYGDDRTSVAAKLAALKEAGTVRELRVDTHSLPDGATGYQFTTPTELQRVEWSILIGFHNDSLHSVSLYAHTLGGDTAFEYQGLRRKYTEVYGEPVTATPMEAVFIKGTQEVVVDQKEQTLSVRYQNTLLNSRIYRSTRGLHFDEQGDSYDSAYYQHVVKPRKAINPDRI